MKKNKTLLVLTAAVLTMTACGAASCGESKSSSSIASSSEDETTKYYRESNEIYQDVLGDFDALYATAKAQTNVSARYAYQAAAEAKMLEKGVMLPLTADGGNYAISRVAPYSVPTVGWGTDEYRYHGALISNGDPLVPEQRDHIKGLWKDATDGADFEKKAKAYLAEQGVTLNRKYKLGYSSEPTTYDILAAYRSVDAQFLVNTYDALCEYDDKSVLQPKLAKALPTVSADGLTYTFEIRDGAKWYTKDGKEFASVTAQDWVDGMHHLLDAQGGLQELVEGLIKNAKEYEAGEVEFKDVGVKAEGNKVIYTLEKATPYFETMLTYNPFAPLCAKYYESKGGKFGADFDSAATDYLYGKDDASIVYCGPYLVDTHTDKSQVIFKLNNNYYDKANVNIDEIDWYFNDGTDAKKAYNDMKTNDLAGASLNTASVAQAKSDKVGSTDKSWFDTYAYTTSTGSGSYPIFFNINRAAYVSVDGSAASSMTERQKEIEKIFMSNTNFRLGLTRSLSRHAYEAAVVGEDLADVSLANSYVPGNFVKTTEKVTIKVDGKDHTYAAGTYYGAMMQDIITKDGFTMKVWDPTRESGIGSSTGYDGWYDEDAAQAYFKKAMEEVKKAGSLTDAELKSLTIAIDVPTYTGSEVYQNRNAAMKKSIEDVMNISTTDGTAKVQVNLTECPKAANWYYAGYYCDYGYERNYTIYDVSGWSPDYGDPQTYLDTMVAYGSMVNSLGIF